MEDKTLLILDDDPLLGKTIQAIAQHIGLNARYCQSSQEFFEVLENWQPDYLAIDLIMPQMDGVQVLLELAHRNCKAPIILTSGAGLQILSAAARSAVAHQLSILGVLAKPFNTKTFRELLAQSNSNQAFNVSFSSPIPQVSSVVADDLVEALANKQISIVYQPKVSCDTYTLRGFEALARWNHPEHGYISPDVFIRIAEENNLIDPLTLAVMDIALPWFASVQQLCSEESPLTLSLNISALSLNNLTLFDRLEQLCLEHRLAPTSIMLELTETAAMGDPITSLDILTRLRMKGFKVSIDDFGTGYSSMLQLVRLPFSELKVDKTFVMTANSVPESKLVIKAIIELAQSLGLQVTAEGIEDEQTLQFLQNLRCDLAQGYLIAKPLSDRQIQEWLFSHYHRKK